MEYIFPSISSLLEKFSTLKWPWLETKTEKKKDQATFFTLPKKVFRETLPQLEEL